MKMLRRAPIQLFGQQWTSVEPAIPHSFIWLGGGLLLFGEAGNEEENYSDGGLAGGCGRGLGMERGLPRRGGGLHWGVGGGLLI